MTAVRLLSQADGWATPCSWYVAHVEESKPRVTESSDARSLCARYARLVGGARIFVRSTDPACLSASIGLLKRLSTCALATCTLSGECTEPEVTCLRHSSTTDGRTVLHESFRKSAGLERRPGGGAPGAEDGRLLSSSAHARTTQDPVRVCSPPRPSLEHPSISSTLTVGRR